MDGGGGDLVLVQIPVTRAAAEVLADADEARRAGEWISASLRPRSPEEDPLVPLITALKARAREDGLTDEDIDAELAAYNAERRDG